jgi:hypothetical protein
MAQHLQRQSIRSPPPSDEKGVALFPLRRFSDDERRREEYFARMELGRDRPRERPILQGFAFLAAGNAHDSIASSLAISFASRVV